MDAVIPVTLKLRSRQEETVHRGPQRGLALVMLLVLASCGGERSSGGERTEDWPLLHVGTLYVMRVPRDMVYKPNEVNTGGF
jgi:hypothetical protein